MSRIESPLTQLVRFLLVTGVLTGVIAAQPSLKVASPPDGSTVHPGESMTVKVEASEPEAFKLVSVIGFDPLGFGEEATDKPPYSFRFEIPVTITPGRYPLTATGFTLSGEMVTSDPITLLVERSDSPVSISVYPPVADFAMDEKRYLQVTGLYADKTTADLTQSSRIRFVSSAPNVAAVQAQGIVTPVAPGSGKITITYGNLKIEVPLKVRGGRR